MSVSAFNHPLPRMVLTGILERAVRFELTYTGFAIRRLAAWRRAQIGTEGEIRTLESSLEDSHVSSYITSAEGISDCEMRIADFASLLLARLKLPIGVT